MRSILLLVLLLGAALALWLWVDRQAGRSGSPDLSGPSENGNTAESIAAPRLSAARSPKPKGETALEGAPPDAAAGEPSRKLQGLVREVGSGRPAGGARILIDPYGDDEFSVIAELLVADAEGRFEFTVDSLRISVLVLGGGWVTDRLAEVREVGFNPLTVTMKPAGLTQHVFDVVRAGSVQGRVLDEHGEPALGAVVSAHAKRRHYNSLFELERLLAEFLATRATADGTFKLDCLVPGLEHRIRAQTDLQGPGWSDAFEVLAGDEHEVDVHLPRARWMRLHVVETKARLPVAGVKFWVTQSSPRTMSRSVTAVSDERGEVALGPLQPGALELHGDQDEWIFTRPLPSGATTTSSEDLDFVIEVDRGAPIAGRVLGPDGQPAGAVFLEAQRLAFEAECRADEAGQFRFPALPTGLVTVRVLNGAWGEAILEQEIEAGTVDVILQLAHLPTPRLKVHVLDPDGDPVPQVGYWVTTEWGGSGTDEGALTPLDLGPSLIERAVRVTNPCDADGHPLDLAGAATGSIGPQTREITIRLRKGVRLNGRVLDPDGQGVAGVGVSVHPVVSGPGPQAGSASSSSSDEKGAFTLRGLSSGARYRMYVDAGDRFAPVPRRQVIADEGDLIIQLEHGEDATLRIVDEKGAAVAGAWIQVSRQRSGGGLAHGQSDEHGAFRAHGLSAGQAYQLEIRPEATHPHLQKVELHDWKVVQTTIKLPTARVIRGTVVDKAGRPVPNASIRGKAGSAELQAAQSAEDGSFVLGHLQADAVAVRASAEGEAWLFSKVLTVPAGLAEPVHLVVRAGARLVLQFKDWKPRLGQVWAVPVPLGTPWAACPGAVIDAKGRALVSSVEVDETYAVHVVNIHEGKTFVAWAPDISGNAGEVTLGFKPARRITGHVRLPAGAGQARLLIRERGIEIRSRTDADGRFMLEGLPEGVFELRAWASGQNGTIKKTVRVAAGSETEIDLSR